MSNLKTVECVQTELMPVSSRKSFYGKAHVLDDLRGARYLKSYATVVCSVGKTGHVRKYFQPETKTTAAHLKSFLATYAPGMTTEDYKKLPFEDRPPIHIRV